MFPFVAVITPLQWNKLLANPFPLTVPDTDKLGVVKVLLEDNVILSLTVIAPLDV
jgi:hypothetical protein